MPKKQGEKSKTIKVSYTISHLIMVIKDEATIENYKKVRKHFRAYFKGFSRHNSVAMTELGTFFGEIEELIFGEAIY